MEQLTEICRGVLAIMEGMMEGEISFTYDNLASAMKYGHPAEILDDILQPVCFSLEDGILPDPKSVEKLLKDLKRFKRSFKVKELTDSIKGLESYLKK